MTGNRTPLPFPWPDGLQVSYEEYLERSGDEWSEWIDGKVVLMTPVGRIHQKLLGFLLALLKHYTEHTGVGEVLTEPFQMKTGPELPGRSPDVIVVTTEHLDRLRKCHLEGPADVVIEIVSPESDTRDRKVKYEEYEKGGVREYWVIDPESGQADFFELTDGRYRPMSLRQGTVFQSSVLPDFWLEVSWLKTPEEERARHSTRGRPVLHSLPDSPHSQVRFPPLPTALSGCDKGSRITGRRTLALVSHRWRIHRFGEASRNTKAGKPDVDAEPCPQSCRPVKRPRIVDREIFVSAEESNRRRIGGFVEGSRTKTEAKRSDRASEDFSTAGEGRCQPRSRGWPPSVGAWIRPSMRRNWPAMGRPLGGCRVSHADP